MTPRPSHRRSRAVGAGSSRTTSRAARIQSVARPDTAAGLAAARGEGIWETSGVIDASRLFGCGLWLVTVQAHEQYALQPGAGLVNSAAAQEDGQVIKLYIPGT